jgi:hypothetical protein
MTVSGAHVLVPYTLSTKKSVRSTFFATLLTNEFNYSGQMTISVAQEFSKTFVRLMFLVTKISVSISFLPNNFVQMTFLVTKISASSSFLTKKSVRMTFPATFLTKEPAQVTFLVSQISVSIAFLPNNFVQMAFLVT